MKKHSEGYVMIYVLVVMVLLALVATGVLSVSLNNLKAQKAAGDRMQELYTAEGIAEQITAEISGQTTEAFFTDTEEKMALAESEIYYNILKLNCRKAGALQMANQIDSSIIGLDFAPETGVLSRAEQADWAENVHSFYMIGVEDFSLENGEAEFLSSSNESLAALLEQRSQKIYDEYCNTDATTCRLPYYMQVQIGSVVILMKFHITLLMESVITRNEESEGEDGKQYVTVDIRYTSQIKDISYDSYEIKTGVAA